MIEIILFIFELCDVTQYFAQLRSACPAMLGWAFLFSTNIMGEGDTKPVTNLKKIIYLA